MNHSPRANKDFFVEQLVYIDENIKDLTSLYLSSTPLHERLKHFFSVYVLELEEFIKQNRQAGFITRIPKVFIGTKVTVLYDEDGETEDYVICFPENSDPDHGFISFLSPVGRQLLLKGIGDQISLKIPTGELRVTIKEISYIGHQFETDRKSKEA
jgi:transcription elongation factor GreA